MAEDTLKIIAGKLGETPCILTARWHRAC
jgi:hypothetical protein